MAAVRSKGLRPSESVLALQLYLSVSVVPLMCLAGLIEERRRAQRALADRLRFEELVARLSRAFVHLPSDQMDEAFGAWLEHVGRFLSLDRCPAASHRESGSGFCVAHSWDARGAYPAPWIERRRGGPWIMARLSAKSRWSWRGRRTSRRRRSPTASRFAGAAFAPCSCCRSRRASACSAASP